MEASTSEDKTVRFSSSLSSSSCESTDVDSYLTAPSNPQLESLIGDTMDKYEKYESCTGNIWLRKKISDQLASSAARSSRLRSPPSPSYSYPTVKPYTPATSSYTTDFTSSYVGIGSTKSLKTYNATMAALLSKYKTTAEESEAKLRQAAAERSGMMAEMAGRDEALKFQLGEGDKMKQHMQELLELMKSNEDALAEIRDENIKLNTELNLANARLDELPVLEAKNLQLQDKLVLIGDDKYNAERKCKLLEGRMEKSCKETRKFIESAGEEQNKAKQEYSALEKSYHQLAKQHEASKLQLEQATQMNVRLTMQVDELDARMLIKEREIDSFRCKQDENESMCKAFKSMLEARTSNA